MNIEDVQFDANGLVPVVVQDAQSGQVLTLAYANREALAKTLETRQSTFWSRSRGELWVKGATSGNTQEVVEVLLDCDQDAVLYRVIPTGPACHTGAETCFHHSITETTTPPLGEVLEKVYRTLRARLRERPEGSYVVKMHDAGLDRILKKIGEEAGEVIIAAKNGSREELAWEAADLLFHLLFTLTELGLSPQDLARVLWERNQKSASIPVERVPPV
ncbi:MULTISPECIES: bifunctional phosphoribosyl-AMP cyclohydrolase/phosphoribosyl-ATP diphosphatase HisIE [unclassified Meiothermus]|uniref:bifunctional phosphoribosyl-AMP cyclohydrolase/phosphoribosyl-ATP diphosphatase HisIE n=1 Tax=unclassified Meiothermus TaxID=370471 RepID=UPI000D7BFA95|nr:MULTISPECIES: bifunctional phosphoribosyl-AMP cyclohydrolase/phosphoribosyl-ATP diphosphatase HisIE [unclassified Meiothermus]PZA08232.1 bifunctional phosphoribosyl-AMP cyclohydrolase/phosphoribosyl-ATP diphosphatase [Meiothermus sp. Pnk-1]RYM38974.1 bifunctional phosphoribosyl-AMP cyclohydrolase/phosphoribosyl-ATP diphosphatase HisIE [Meiothermus sp. PNK-Is4]